jgi:hypothetical protein
MLHFARGPELKMPIDRCPFGRSETRRHDGVFQRRE